MAMDIFSANPKSFKIHRSSPLADAKLKPSISAKLLHFLPELTDDVFAEYITVLVCNGKDQYQAREDLDAFLGERTEEFVSWLWGHLLKRSRKWGIEASLKNEKDVSVTGPQNSDDDPKTRGNDGTVLADDLLTCRKEISCKFEAAEKIFVESCAPDSPGEGSPPVLSATRNQSVLCAKETKLILDRKACVALKEISSISTRDPAFKHQQSSVSAADPPSSSLLSASVSPRSARALSIPRPRVSVWDRLGKPSKDVPAEDKGVYLSNVGHKKQDEELQNWHLLIASGLKASWLDKGSGGHNNHDQIAETQNCVSGTFDPHAANNIRQKRLFGETSSSPNAGSVPLKDTRKLMPPVTEICQELKKSKLATNDSGTSPSLASKMLEMRQRLHNMEMEMSKLRSKQVTIAKDGKRCQMSNPSELKHLEEDIDSRTVFVTNVHFAATKEALSLFFAKCGTVVKVVKVIDTVTAKPKGTAYVTFVSKDSIDRALALSGKTFLSRIVKVSRKKEADAAASTPTQLAQKPSQASTPSTYRSAVSSKPYYYSSSRLQWQRENVGPSCLSASLKKIASASNQS